MSDIFNDSVQFEIMIDFISVDKSVFIMYSEWSQHFFIKLLKTFYDTVYRQTGKGNNSAKMFFIMSEVDALLKVMTNKVSSLTSE